MSKASVEEIKLESNGLRGQIAEQLHDPALSHVEDSENVLLKFHGTYQQDDRDQRAALTKEKKDKAWSFMVRSKMPGGRISAAQWLIHHDLCVLSEGTLRLTNRQGIQLHGVLKGNLKAVIQGISKSGLTTMGACGDVVRNTMGPAAPIKDAVHEDAQRLSEELSQRFLWRSSSYADIWLDGEKIELDWAQVDVNPAVRDKTAASNGDAAADPIYGTKYLPRKFKIGIAIQPQNDVDVFSQDLGFVPHLENGEVAGYTVTVGGGLVGMVKSPLVSSWTGPWIGQWKRPLWCSPLPRRLAPDETAHIAMRLSRLPERAPAPLCPRPEVLPCPVPGPRPSRLRGRREPGAGVSECSPT